MLGLGDAGMLELESESETLKKENQAMRSPMHLKNMNGQ